MKKWLLTIISLVLAVTLTACGGNESDENTLVVGATSKPHGDILEEAKNILKDEYDIDLEIKIFYDYFI
ncbi:MAG: methionine ABC transporter substrate-binding protein, partial [Thomasclavelia spiroformis]